MENVATNETSSLLDDITSLEELEALEFLDFEGLLITDKVSQTNKDLFEIDVNEFYPEEPSKTPEAYPDTQELLFGIEI